MTLLISASVMVQHVYRLQCCRTVAWWLYIPGKAFEPNWNGFCSCLYVCRQVFDAHATDESSMMDELSQAQEQLSQAQNQLTGTEAELQHKASQLAYSLAEQVDLRGQLEQLRSERHGLDEAHEMAEATLLDQLTQTQAELEQSSTQVSCTLAHDAIWVVSVGLSICLLVCLFAFSLTDGAQ